MKRKTRNHFDDLVDRNLLASFRDTAKQFHTGQKESVPFLLGKKYIYRDKAEKLLPYQRYVDDGLFELKECVNKKSGWKGTQTPITPKGRETFRLLFIGAASVDTHHPCCLGMRCGNLFTNQKEKFREKEGIL